MADLDHEAATKTAQYYLLLPEVKDVNNLAACYLDLQAKLETERKISATRIVDLLKRATASEQRLREVEAATIERCARTAETYIKGVEYE